MIGIYADHMSTGRLQARTYTLESGRWYGLDTEGLHVHGLSREDALALRDSLQRALDEAAAEDAVEEMSLQFADLLEPSGVSA